MWPVIELFWGTWLIFPVNTLEDVRETDHHLMMYFCHHFLALLAGTVRQDQRCHPWCILKYGCRAWWWGLDKATWSWHGNFVASWWIWIGSSIRHLLIAFSACQPRWQTFLVLSLNKQVLRFFFPFSNVAFLKFKLHNIWDVPIHSLLLESSGWEVGNITYSTQRQLHGPSYSLPLRIIIYPFMILGVILPYHEISFW